MFTFFATYTQHRFESYMPSKFHSVRHTERRSYGSVCVRWQKSEVTQDGVGTSSTFGLPLKSVGYWLKPVQWKASKLSVHEPDGLKEIDRKMDIFNYYFFIESK